VAASWSLLNELNFLEQWPKAMAAIGRFSHEKSQLKNDQLVESWVWVNTYRYHF